MSKPHEYVGASHCFACSTIALSSLVNENADLRLQLSKSKDTIDVTYGQLLSARETINDLNARIARLQAECRAWRAVSAHEHPAESRAERWKLKDARATVDAHNDVEPKTYTYGPFEPKTCRPEDIRPLGSGDQSDKE